LIFSRGGPISLEDISQVIGSERVTGETEETVDEAIRQWVLNALTSGTAKDVFTALMDRFTVILIAEALKVTGGNRSRAAELLGMSRPTLLSKIEKYQLRIETSVRGD
jgi:DNA-binding NtrC family response regulator